MPIERSKRPIGAARIASLARRLLDASTLCALATVSPGGRAHVNTAYFAWSPEFDVVWLSDPQARHSRNVSAGGSVAIAVYDSSQSWGNPDRGIQLFGSAREADGDGEAEAIYARRFSDYDPEDFAGYRLYRFRPRRLKVFDERALGSAVFVSARVAAGGRLAWERTERYRR
jgi:uncharacterized protein YhbP (UPF0306 family)